jgi:hypothetical protein
MKFNVGDEVRLKIGFFEKRPYGALGMVTASSARTYTVQFVDSRNNVTEKKMRYCDHECDLCPGEYEITVASNALKLYEISVKLQKLLAEPFRVIDSTLPIRIETLNEEVRIAKALLANLNAIVPLGKTLNKDGETL